MIVETENLELDRLVAEDIKYHLKRQGVHKLNIFLMVIDLTNC